MAKALKTAAIIVGVAALAATGIGAAIGAAGVIAGVTGATLTAVGAIAGVASSLMTLAASALAGKPPPGTVAGNPTKFTIEKQSGIPYTMGRTLVGGRVAHRQFYGPKNVYESWVSILSLGPVKSVGPLLIDKVTAVALAGTAALGAYAGYMWLDTQIGATPEARALAGPAGAIPGWDATSKLSGLAADLWTLKWDKEGKVFPTGVPVRGRVIEGVLVYDPRQDSTYPGGSGPCRLGDEETYVYSENPACHAVTWAFGRYQNDVLVAGGGLAASGIDMATFAEWANVCDANGWKVGGTVFTEADNSWDVLRMIAQAGGGECIPVGARLAAIFSAPRVSIGTITSNDVCGPINVPATAASRIRRNTIIPKVRLESQGWEMTPLDPVSVPEYVALDGASRPRELDLPLVQQADQGAELALYAMLNDRELDGISITAKIYALGYRPGDCLTLDIPEANLIGRDVILREREIDAASMAVTLTCRSETPEKHSYALGQSGTPPRTPDLSSPGVDRSAPAAGDWSLAATVIVSDNLNLPALVIAGQTDERPLSGVVFEYRPFIEGADPGINWTGASIEPANVSRKEISGIEGGSRYEVAVRYRVRGALTDRLILGPVTTPQVDVTYDDGTPVDDLKPAAPGADVTGDNTSKDTENVGGRPSTEVIVDQDRGLINQLRASARAEVDRQRLRARLFPGGDGAAVETLIRRESDARSALAQLVNTVSAASGVTQATVLQVLEAMTDGEEGFARFLLRAEVIGGVARFASLEGYVGGGLSALDFTADRIRFIDPDTSVPYIYFDVDANGIGTMRASKVVVDTLEVNTAVVPLRAIATAELFGGGSTGAWQTALSGSITLTKAGWIEAGFVAKQHFSDGDDGWEFEMLIGDASVFNVTGTKTQDSVPVSGARLMPAGTHTVLTRWRADGSIRLRNRNLFAKAYPDTQ